MQEVSADTDRDGHQRVEEVFLAYDGWGMDWPMSTRNKAVPVSGLLRVVKRQQCLSALIRLFLGSMLRQGE